jgi:hypothetical protein
MEKKEFEDYLHDLYYPQIDWYDKKSISNQKFYKVLQWSIIILSALTPVIIASGYGWQRWSAVAISSLVAIGTASLKAFKYQENWINYRTTCETLRKEIHYFNAKIDDYENSDDPMGVFVERVELLISRENTMWLTVQKVKEHKSNI